jgi:hypothetical protein
MCLERGSDIPWHEHAHTHTLSHTHTQTQTDRHRDRQPLTDTERDTQTQIQTECILHVLSIHTTMCITYDIPLDKSSIGVKFNSF